MAVSVVAVAMRLGVVAVSPVVLVLRGHLVVDKLAAFQNKSVVVLDRCPFPLAGMEVMAH